MRHFLQFPSHAKPKVTDTGGFWINPEHDSTTGATAREHSQWTCREHNLGLRIGKLTRYSCFSYRLMATPLTTANREQGPTTLNNACIHRIPTVVLFNHVL